MRTDGILHRIKAEKRVVAATVICGDGGNYQSKQTILRYLSICRVPGGTNVKKNVRRAVFEVSQLC